MSFFHRKFFKKKTLPFSAPKTKLGRRLLQTFTATITYLVSSMTNKYMDFSPSFWCVLPDLSETTKGSGSI